MPSSPPGPNSALAPSVPGQLCFVIPFRRIVSLVPAITAFTIGHSVTLIGTAYNIAPVGAWFPPIIETEIAVSIVYMALENIVGANLRRRWIIAGLFGLVHGFGFADILKEQLQFAGSYLLVSLFSFNLGIEIGQLAVPCVFLPEHRTNMRYPKNPHQMVDGLFPLRLNPGGVWASTRRNRQSSAS